MFVHLEEHGFSTVRVCLDPVSPKVRLFESRDATTLSPVYMASICDFLRRAGGHDAYVIAGFSMWGPN